jgi:hypothetical protein
MTLPGGQYLPMLAVGPTDVSVDRSTLTGQRSTCQPVSGTHGSASEADRWGPRTGRVKEKGKELGSYLGPKTIRPAQGPIRLGLAQMGQLG